MRTEYVTISPKMAQAFLGASNRPVRQGTVARYKNDMLKGNWKLTHQGIAIDKDGNLIDGQHRMLAIIAANTPVLMPVTYNATNDIFDVLDSGANRTPADTLALSGYSPRTAKLMTASIPYCVNFEASGIINGSLMPKKYGNSTIFIKDFIEKNPAIIKSAEFAQTLPYRYSLLKQSVACFIHYEISRKYDDANEFLDKLLIGDGVTSDTVFFELRNMLIAQKNNKNSSMNEALLVKRLLNGYNHFHAKRQLKDWSQAVRRPTLNSVITIE